MPFALNIKITWTTTRQIQKKRRRFTFLTILPPWSWFEGNSSSKSTSISPKRQWCDIKIDRPPPAFRFIDGNLLGFLGGGGHSRTAGGFKDLGVLTKSSRQSSSSSSSSSCRKQELCNFSSKVESKISNLSSFGWCSIMGLK